MAHRYRPYTTQRAPDKLKPSRFLDYRIPSVISEGEIVLLSPPAAPAPSVPSTAAAPSSPPPPPAEPADAAPAATPAVPTATDASNGARLEPVWQEIKDKLNDAKNFFDTLPGTDFDRLMFGMDMYHGLKRTLREQFGMQVCTNASMKMSEILVEMKLFPRKGSRRIRVFCNAELPGAFVVAINHYIHTRYRDERFDFDWVASSFYPEDGEFLLGDAYGFYAGNRDRWFMGPRPNALPEHMPTITGDVTDPRTVEATEAAVQARFGREGATLYTSDVGVGVSDDYGSQEETTSALNFGQIVCGLFALGKGGSLVTKQYTFFTAFNRSLAAILSTLFDVLYVTKPRTSRPTNSETYLIGKGFRGLSPSLRASLLAWSTHLRAQPGPASHAGSLVGPELLAAVDKVLLPAARKLFLDQQVEYLREAASFYKRYKDTLGQLPRLLGSVTTSLQRDWLDCYSPEIRIDPRDHLRSILPARASGPAPAAGVAAAGGASVDGAVGVSDGADAAPGAAPAAAAITAVTAIAGDGVKEEASEEPPAKRPAMEEQARDVV
eukprot:m.47325 g.47325  ORF g.47325 m.47325 type:complete len:551 (+) comp11259_c0_seq1:21-1673(+)